MANIFDICTVPSRVINLDRDTNKLKNFRSRFNPLGIHPQREPAVLGKNLNFQELLDRHMVDASIAYQMKHGRSINSQINTLGAIGCYLSHVNIWQQLVNDTSTDMYMVFEDDCAAPSAAIPVINSFVNQTIQRNPDWGIIYLGYSDGGGILPSTQQQVDAQTERICDSILCTHAYLINRQGAQTCLEHAFPIVFHVDWYLSYQCTSGRLNGFCPTKPMFRQTASGDPNIIHWDQKNGMKLLLNWLPNWALQILVAVFFICLVCTIIFIYNKISRK